MDLVAILVLWTDGERGIHDIDIYATTGGIDQYGNRVYFYVSLAYGVNNVGTSLTARTLQIPDNCFDP